MNYSPTTWQDTPSVATLVTAARLQNIENGIVATTTPSDTTTQDQKPASAKIKVRRGASGFRLLGLGLGLGLGGLARRGETADRDATVARR